MLAEGGAVAVGLVADAELGGGDDELLLELALVIDAHLLILDADDDLGLGLGDAAAEQEAGREHGQGGGGETARGLGERKCGESHCTGKVNKS